jgi:hypothetical protein
MTKQIISKLVFLGISLVMFIYLVIALKENNSNFFQTAILTMFIILLFAGFIFKYSDTDTNEIRVNDVLFSILFCAFSCILTRILIIEANLPLDLSASIIGLLGIIIETIFLRLKFTFKPAAVIYCGTFIGVTSILVLESYLVLLMAGILGGIFFIFLKNSYVGVGGRLGAIAFMSVFIISLSMPQ